MVTKLTEGFAARRLIAVSILAMTVVAAGIGVAAELVLVRYWAGTPAALFTCALTSTAGALVLWPGWFTLRAWAGGPRLESHRRDLIEAITAAPSHSDSEALAGTFLRVLAPLFRGRSLGLLLADDERGELRVIAVAGQECSRYEGLVIPRRGVTARLLEPEGGPLTLGEWMGDALVLGAAGSDLAVPLRTRSQLVGVLLIGGGGGHGLSRDEQRLLLDLAPEMAYALESAGLYESLQHAAADLETAQRELLALQRASTAAQSTLRLSDVLRNVCGGVLDGLDYREALIFLVDPTTKLITPVTACGRPLTPKLRRVATDESGERLLLTPSRPHLRGLLRNEVAVSNEIEATIVPALVEPECLQTGGPLEGRTVVTVPLVANGEVVGGMVLLTERAEIAEREQESLRGFAAQAATAIVNARLYEDLREAYDDLRVAQDQVLRSERLRNLGELTSGVAHDFNNILMAVLSHAQIAQRSSDRTSMLHALRVIEQAAEDGVDVVRRIQNLARVRSVESRERVDLTAILRQATETAAPVVRATAEARGAEIAIEFEGDGQALVEGTPSELREVFVNLIYNAAQAMPEGGRLTIRCRVQDGHVWGEVSDTGTGMTDEVKRRVFEPFFTTKGAAGSGLGLSIVASIARRHSGLVEIDSTLHEGTTVRVGLPVATARVPASGVHHRRVQMRGTRRVLVVDADRPSREALTVALEQLGHAVTAVATDQEALGAFLDGGFEVVITDLRPASVTGWELGAAVKRLKADTRVVLVSDRATEMDEQDLVARGVDAVLATPFTPDELRAALEYPPHAAVA